MPRFSETQGAETQFSGHYDVAGWVKARDLRYITFTIDGVDFRTSNWNGVEAEEYVMFIRFELPSDAENLGFSDADAEYGVSGRHNRILQQLKNMREEDFPVELVTITEVPSRMGNPSMMLADPTSLDEPMGSSTTSQQPTTGATGGSPRTNTTAQTNGNGNKPANSTQRPAPSRNTPSRGK